MNTYDHAHLMQGDNAHGNPFEAAMQYQSAQLDANAQIGTKELVLDSIVSTRYAHSGRPSFLYDPRISGAAHDVQGSTEVVLRNANEQGSGVEKSLVLQRHQYRLRFFCATCA